MMIAIRLSHRRYRGATALTKIGVIASRADDPVVPAQVLEADIERLPAALPGAWPTLQGSAVAPLARVFGVED